MKTTKEKKKSVNIYFYLILLLTAVFIIYLPAIDYEFVWDDTELYLNKSQFHPDMNFSDYLKFWKPAKDKMYMPVTYTFWTVAYLLSGKPEVEVHSKTESKYVLNPALFHFINLLVHLLNGILIFLIIRKIIKSNIASIAGAAIFLLHPVQIESVVWVSELRGLLAVFFGMLSIIYYMNYVERTLAMSSYSEFIYKESVIQYQLSILFSILSFLSKPSAIVIPAIIITIDYFQYRRSIKKILKSTGLFVLLTIPIMLNAKFVESDFPPDFGAPLWARPFVFFDSISFYLYKIFLPLEQIADYSRKPSYIMDSPWFYISWTVAVSILIYLFINRRKLSIIFMSFVIFILGFLPVSGLVSFYFQDWSTVADRYLYLSMSGIALACGYILYKIEIKKLAITLTGVIIIIFIILIRSHISVWQDEFSLWSDVISKNSDKSAHAYCGRGYYYLENGRYLQALEDFNKAISINPTYARAYYNRGNVYLDLNNLNQALKDFSEAIVLGFNNPNAYINRAIAYSKTGMLDSAISDYERALKYDIIQPDVYVNRGIIYAEKGMLDEAIKDFQIALKYEPEDKVAFENLNIALDLKKKLKLNNVENVNTKK